MMEDLNNSPNFLSERILDLNDAALWGDISDSLCEREKVKFTVHTKKHEKFTWLNDSSVANEDYAGYTIHPALPRPDCDASSEELQKLGKGEGSMTKEEFTKMKQELEKTVAMHEVFLCYAAARPILRKDLNFYNFLEFNKDLSVRGKRMKKRNLKISLKTWLISADGVVVSGVKAGTSAKSDRITRSDKSAGNDCNRMGSSLSALGTQDSTNTFSEPFDKTGKIEAQVSADEDLKLPDLLQYYLIEFKLLQISSIGDCIIKMLTKKIKTLCRLRCPKQLCCQKLEKISESAKQECTDFKTKRVTAFRKKKLELKHAKGNHSCYRIAWRCYGDT
ncbi:hypothetical protein K5549_002976 [Capra hircus]|nr:hypothetical protein K5549_002976 [Capra hircus]